MIALINIKYENPFVTNKVSMGFVPQKSENQKNITIPLQKPQKTMIL